MNFTVTVARGPPFYCDVEQDQLYRARGRQVPEGGTHHEVSEMLRCQGR